MGKHQKLRGLLWVVPQHNIVSLAAAKCNFWSPTSNPFHLSCCPNQTWL